MLITYTKNYNQKMLKLIDQHNDQNDHENPSYRVGVIVLVEYISDLTFICLPLALACVVKKQVLSNGYLSY
jgi:hypothetical protein